MGKKTIKKPNPRNLSDVNQRPVFDDPKKIDKNWPILAHLSPSPQLSEKSAQHDESKVSKPQQVSYEKTVEPIIPGLYSESKNTEEDSSTVNFLYQKVLKNQKMKEEIKDITDDLLKIPFSAEKIALELIKKLLQLKIDGVVYLRNQEEIDKILEILKL